MKPKPKVVFDTNIYISAIIFGGNPRTCLELARLSKIELFTSKIILLELTQKLKNKFAWNNEEIVDVIEGVSKYVRIVEPKTKVFKIKKDLSDNKILEAASTAGVDFIISGDKKHILPLKKFEKSLIFSAKDFLEGFYNGQMAHSEHSTES